MGGVVKAVESVVSNPMQAITSIASAVFPPAAIACSLANAVSGVVGQAVNQLAQQLTSQCGMPSFLQDIVGQVVKQAVGQQQQPSDPDCDHACQNDFGKDLEQFGKDLTQALLDGVKSLTDPNPIGRIFDSIKFAGDINKLKGDLQDLAQDATSGGQGCGGSQGTDGSNGSQGTNGYNPNGWGNDDGTEGSSGKGGKGGSTNWLIAMAQAMGKVAGEHAQKLADLSNKIEGESGNAQQANEDMTQMQAESQLFGMLENAFSNTIKTIGQSLSTMASKQ